MHGAEYGPDGSNWQWKLAVAWLWLTHPVWMIQSRKVTCTTITVPQHTFGPLAPILPVPDDQPQAPRPAPRPWSYHIGSPCGTPKGDGTCGCGSRSVLDA